MSESCTLTHGGILNTGSAEGKEWDQDSDDTSQTLK